MRACVYCAPPPDRFARHAPTRTHGPHDSRARSILLHAHDGHVGPGHDGAGVFQGGIGGFERRGGGVVDFGHGGELLVLHVVDGVGGDGDLGVFGAGFLVRRGVKG